MPQDTLANYFAKRKAEAEARSWAPDWEERKIARLIARRPLVRFHAAKRKAAQLLRTPPWADMDAIKTFYLDAEAKRRETGIEHHVDHIYPLQGEKVSGLHVHTNLRVIQGVDNMRKGNRYEPE